MAGAPPTDDRIPDEELAARCQRGDYAAFAELYARWHRPILAFIHQIVHDYDGTACIAQDVFLKVFTKVDSFDTSRRFTTWLYTVARNTAIDWLHARKRRAMVTFSDLAADEDGAREPRTARVSADVIEQALTNRESTELLRAAIAELPQIYREVIELVMFQDLSYEEAGAILGGVSSGTLRSRMFHALRRLRCALEDVAGPDGRDLF
jgi:RNA polymerase sigma-70 factor (ECF subfamily)